MLSYNFKVIQGHRGQYEGVLPATQSCHAGVPRGTHAKVGLGTGGDSEKVSSLIEGSGIPSPRPSRPPGLLGLTGEG